MLEHVVGAETVIGDVWALHLNRRFGAVLVLSHLINTPARSRRLALLRVCREHLEDDGIIVMQRYPPDWVPTESEAVVGAVAIRLHDLMSWVVLAAQRPPIGATVL
jgi:ABC-type sugar transport system substrate-binding protein